MKKKKEKVFKDYLSQSEMDIWLVSVLAIAELEDSLPKMENHLTSDEVRNLKTAITVVRKAYNSVSGRLGDKAVNKLHRYGRNCNIQVVDKVRSRVMSEREAKEQATMDVDLDILHYLASNVVADKCKNCRKKCNECYTFGILQDIDYIGCEENSNCPYSFNFKEEKKKTKKDKKSRHDKKFKARYDEEDSTYNYVLGGNK